MEAAPSDQSTGIQWWNGSAITTGAAGITIGTGQTNTTAIVTSQGAGSYAAQLCNDLIIGSYSDWFLPSKDEIYPMYVNLKAHGVGGFTSSGYWSSSEIVADGAWLQDFNLGSQDYNNKLNTFYVRCIRAY